jgi:hypothetical protein
VLIENTLGRRLFRVVCTLHLNELPWRHIFIDLDGPTHSKSTFKGVIGRILPKVKELEWNTKFKKVTDGPGLPNISDEIASDLSSDQLGYDRNRIIQPETRTEPEFRFRLTDWKILGPLNLKTLMEDFLTLQLSRSESFRAIKLSTLENFLTLKSKTQKENFRV